MHGYLLKEGDFEAANEAGIKAIQLNEENWKAWKVWAVFYRNICSSAEDQEFFLANFSLLLAALSKSMRYKTQKTMLFVGEVVELISNHTHFLAGPACQELDDFVRSFELFLKKTPMWSWVCWLSNLTIHLPKTGNP